MVGETGESTSDRMVVGVEMSPDSDSAAAVDGGLWQLQAPGC